MNQNDIMPIDKQYNQILVGWDITTILLSCYKKSVDFQKVFFNMSEKEALQFCLTNKTLEKFTLN